MVMLLEERPATLESLSLDGVELDPEGFPFMNAAGSVNGPGEENLRRDFMDVARAPGAAAMLGSITSLPREGNVGSVYTHVQGTGLSYNSMGLGNLGVDRVAKILPEFVRIAEDNGKKLGVSLAPLTDNPGAELAEMTEKVLDSGVHIIEYNAGCPNIYDSDGNPKKVLSHDPDAMGEALEYVEDRVGLGFATGVKLSPSPVSSFGHEAIDQYDRSLLRRQAEVINSLGIGYVAFLNTFGGHVPVAADGGKKSLSVPSGAGGVSGPGIAHIARSQTAELLEHLSEDTDVVVAGGINTGQELFYRVNSDPRIKLGSAVTPLLQAPSLGEGATRLAREYALASQS